MYGARFRQLSESRSLEKVPPTSEVDPLFFPSLTRSRFLLPLYFFVGNDFKARPPFYCFLIPAAHCILPAAGNLEEAF